MSELNFVDIFYALDIAILVRNENGLVSRQHMASTIYCLGSSLKLLPQQVSEDRLSNGSLVDQH